MYKRADVLRELYEKLPNRETRVRSGCSVKAIEQDENGVTVHIEGGGLETGDIVIGADGVYSKVREIMWSHARDKTTDEALKKTYKTGTRFA
jgi:2-polyprenyl-6-methoxyphenol hydroxylase-like FAD-dependent oxidoreductase